MAFDFFSAADDFFVNLNLQTTLALPTNRESVLHFCEAVQKEFRSMTGFYQRDSGEYVLEGSRESGKYRWLEIHTHRLSAGYFNPEDLAGAYALHEWLLERSVYYLGVGGLDVECLDVLFGFNLDYQGNRDAIVAEALLGSAPIGALMGDGGLTCVECEPNLVTAIDTDCYAQARLSLETRSNTYQVRTGQYDDEPISVYFTVRQYPQPGSLLDLKASFGRQCEQCEDLTRRIVIPQIVRPIAAAISAAQ